MFYCFLNEDIEMHKEDTMKMQMEYAQRIGRLYIGDIKYQKIYDGCDQKRSVELMGKKILLRSTYDNMLPGIRLLKKFGAELIESESDIDKIENWYKLGLANRPIFHVDLSEIERGMLDINLQKHLEQWDKIFLKSVKKGFSAIIKTPKIVQKDSQILAFLKEQALKYGEQFIITKYMEIRIDSIGKRESRHIVINSNVLNSSRMIHSIRHTVPKSHLNKALKVAFWMKNIKDFPQNYVLDLGEYKDANGEICVDIIELNPLTCSMCYVNNSIFTTEVSEIKDIKEKFLMGYEYCYNALYNPQNYHQIRSSIKDYSYTTDEKYYFL